VILTEQWQHDVYTILADEVNATEQPAPFAALLRGFRLAAGLTQAELADRAGLSLRGVSDLERGVRRAPHARTVRQFAEALRLSDDETRALLAAARGAEVDQVDPVTRAPAQELSNKLQVQAPLAALDTPEVPRIEAAPCGLVPRGRGSRVRPMIVVASLVGALAISLGIVVLPRLGVNATAATPTPSPSATSVAGDLVLADSLANPADAAFVRDQSGTTVAGFSDGTSATYLWDSAYMYSAIVAHVLGPYPANPDHAWLGAGVSLEHALPQDFAIQVRGRVTRSPESSAFGLAVEPAAGQVYEFDVLPADRSYRLALPQGQAPMVEGQSSWILPPSQPNLLRFEVRGDGLRVLANGHELARAAPPSPSDHQPARLSLRWALTGPPSQGNSVEVRFAQFALYALP